MNNYSFDVIKTIHYEIITIFIFEDYINNYWIYKPIKFYDDYGHH